MYVCAGWQKDTSNCRTWEDLPQAARNYVETIENEVKVPIRWIGIGQERAALIHKPCVV